MNGAGAVRGGPGKVRREAHTSIPIPPRRSTVATSLQPSLSASSAVRPRQQNSLSSQTNAPSRSSYPRGPSIPPAWKSRGTCSSGWAFLIPAAPTPQRRPAVPERQLPATPAIGPLSSESIVLMLRRLRRCLTPAQTVLVCLWCPTSSARDIHCMDTAAVAAQRRRPVYSTQYSN